MIVEEIDTAKATRMQAVRRRNHPVFKSFWDMGEKLLEGKTIDLLPDITPLTSARRNIKIAAAQIAASRNISDNIGKIKSCIQSAAGQGADVVVFPELAVTGSVKEDIAAATQSALDKALSEIRRQADEKDIYVIVGMPYFVEGQRRSCAFVIADDGTVKTQYAQLTAVGGELFVPGAETKAMWFELKGVHSIVTIGDDADMVEIADLAACRGMYLHFHIACETYASADEVLLGKQRHLLMLLYAGYGAVVNAAADMSNQKSQAGGMSMIVSREGGHNKPAPSGIEYYLPYQTSVAKSAGLGEEMITATRRTEAKNDMDLVRYWRNRNRKNRSQKGWYDWMKKGTMLIRPEAD